MIRYNVYYSLIQIASVIDQVGYDKLLLQDNGVLFDAEFDEDATDQKRSLLYNTTTLTILKDIASGLIVT